MFEKLADRVRLRLWWQPASKATDRNDDRSVSFLELFYDLVYVVLIAEIAHALSAHLDLKHLWQFVFLSGIVWWAWLNGTTYHEYHGNNDIRTRIFTFMQMFAVAGMAVFAHHAMGEGSKGFAIFYAIFQLILGYLWLRLAVHDPEHHQENRSFVIFFGISTALFFISVFIPTPYRFYLWGVAVFITLAQPLLISVFRHSPTRSFHFSPALIERFGLFNILVLAEIVVGVVSGLSEHETLGAGALLAGGLGMCVACGMWWLYFSLAAHRKPKQEQVSGAVWLYMHLFVSMSIVATGAAIFNVVAHAGEPLDDTVRWILVGAVEVYFLSLLPLTRVLQVGDLVKAAYNNLSTILLISAVMMGLVGLTHLSINVVLFVLVLLMAVPVVYSVVLWIRLAEAGEIQVSEPLQQYLHRDNGQNTVKDSAPHDTAS